MKKTITTIACLLAYFASFSQVSCLNDDLSSATPWTQMGTTVSVTGGKIKFNNTSAGSDNRVYRTVPELNFWKLDFSFNSISHISSGPAQILMAYSAGSQLTETSGAQQARVIYLSNPTGSTPKLFVDGGGGSSTGILAPAGSTYYIRLERSNLTELKLSVFSDVAMTVHVAGSPIIANTKQKLDGLNTLQSANSTLGSGHNLTAEIDNISFCGSPNTCNNISPNAITWIQKGTTVTASGTSILFNNTFDDGVDRRVYATVDTKDIFDLNFSFKPTDYSASPGPAHILLAYSKGSLHSETAGNDQVRIIYLNDPASIYFDATGSTGNPGIVALKGSTYYVQLQRNTPTELVLSVFSDVAMTQHVAGSPQVKVIPETLKGLNTFQSGNSLLGNGTRFLSAELSNFKLCGASIDYSTVTAIDQESQSAEVTENYTKMKVYDGLGRQLMERDIQNGNWNDQIPGLREGIYIIKLSDGNKYKSFKIAVKE